MKQINLPKIDLKEYTYDLPEEKIAKHPLQNRDDSKLLYYDKGSIQHKKFPNIVDIIPDNALLYFNNTKVIPARLFFRKSTGAQIEIFLLQPVLPSPIISIAMEQTRNCTWKCIIGNFRKWKDGNVLERTISYEGKEISIQAKISNRKKMEIEFEWDADVSFAELVDIAGTVPLPPYMNRDAEEDDKPRYQTVYSKNEGAVAAPTSGLHFTDEILDQIKSKGVKFDELTLHVSAGTFQPVKEKNAIDHPMHSEQIILTRKNVENIVNHEGPIYCVGTTSMRTLESSYWYGVKLIFEGSQDFFVEKLRPYQYNKEELPSMKEAFQAIAKEMDNKNLSEINGNTEIFLFPGYDFKVIDGIITNFHQPRSTLILLVAAFVGEDWKKIYKEALENEYRFLSYGDSSILIK